MLLVQPQCNFVILPSASPFLSQFFFSFLCHTIKCQLQLFTALGVKLLLCSSLMRKLAAKQLLLRLALFVNMLFIIHFS